MINVIYAGEPGSHHPILSGGQVEFIRAFLKTSRNAIVVSISREPAEYQDDALGITRLVTDRIILEVRRLWDHAPYTGPRPFLYTWLEAVDYKTGIWVSTEAEIEYISYNIDYNDYGYTI